jgi:sulfur carrier protein ThiS
MTPRAEGPQGVRGLTVRVRLFATYRRYLPEGASGGEFELDLPAGSRLGDAVARLGLPVEGESVFLVNGRTLPPEVSLQEGDVISAFPAMAGGGRDVFG